MTGAEAYETFPRERLVRRWCGIWCRGHPSALAAVSASGERRPAVAAGRASPDHARIIAATPGFLERPLRRVETAYW